MADTGSPYNLPYPALSDEANGPQWIQDLAEGMHAALDLGQPRMARRKDVSQSLTTLNVMTNLTYEYQEADPQASPGVAYASGVWTVDRPGIYQVNAIQHFQITGAVTARLGLLYTNALGSSASIMINIGYMVINSSLTISRTWRMQAGESFTIQAMSNAAGCIAYGSTTRYSVCDVSLVAG